MISIILPTYNEAENIKILVPRLHNLFIEKGIQGEIILVDDDSPDGTAAVARNLVEAHPLIIHVRKKDRGLSKAVIKGFELANGDICVVMDADLSHPVEKVPAMISPILEGEYDLVVGSRYLNGGGWKNFSLFRKAASKAAGFLAKGVTCLSDPTSGFMAVRKSILEGQQLDALSWKIVLEVTVKTNPRILEIPIRFGERRKGRSKLDLRVQLDYFYHLWCLYCFKFPLISQFARFCLVGLSGLVIDTAVLVCLVEYLFFDPRISAVFAFIVAANWNYLLNRSWTFSPVPGIKTFFNCLLFIAVCLIGLGIRITVMHLLIAYGHMGKSPWYVMASLVGIACATAFNFIGSKYVVFSSPMRRG